jgi:alpha-L-rhamnosidase
VRSWLASGERSEWSDPSFWETGLLEHTDWLATWIGSPINEDESEPAPAKLLRKTFDVDKPVKTARLYVTALGLYEARINGQVVGDQVFTPGWTSYHHRLQYQTFDVADSLQLGPNAIGVTLADGWYRGFQGWNLKRNLYGDRLGLLAQLEIEFGDGSRMVVTSDREWTCSTGPIRSADLYMGETYDARLVQTGWDTAAFDDGTWSQVETLEPPSTTLVGLVGPPVRRIEELRPIAIQGGPKGHPIVDMGQNMVGRVRIRVSGPAGTVIKLRHAEVPDTDGGLYVENLRHAKQEDTYVLAGNGQELYEPCFTFHGFRYVEVEGYPGELTADDVKGVVIHSDLERTGSFETSNALLNQLQHNIVWGQKGNFLDIPTDCPQRDERLGWTGDAQVFAPTAAFNMLVAPFFSKWLADLSIDQKPNGSVSWVVPDILADTMEQAHGACGWGDAAVLVPWTLYQLYGDARILERQYDSMRRWVEFVRERAGDRLIWEGDEHFGDWLAFAPGHPGFPGATTSKDLLATAFFAHSTAILAEAAQVLGNSTDYSRYRSLSVRIRQAFQSEFVSPAGRLVSETQTAYALALAFDLLPPEDRPSAADRLAENVRTFGHLTTGFLGAPILSHVLTDYGYTDLAYELLMREDFPSWLYPVTQGATTIWERWDSQKPDGSFQDPGMNSFNHYAYGAVGDWMYRVIGGINQDPLYPGYKRVLIRPRPGGGLTYAKAHLQTMNGFLRSEWEIIGDTLKLSVEIPPNTTARIIVPDATTESLTESGKPVDQVFAPGDLSQLDDGLELRTGSGQYWFARTGGPE